MKFVLFRHLCATRPTSSVAASHRFNSERRVDERLIWTGLKAWEVRLMLWRRSLRGRVIYHLHVVEFDCDVSSVIIRLSFLCKDSPKHQTLTPLRFSAQLCFYKTHMCERHTNTRIIFIITPPAFMWCVSQVEAFSFFSEGLNTFDVGWRLNVQQLQRDEGVN